jgi:hypothetical protein
VVNVEKEKEEPEQKEFSFMDETPPSLLFPFMIENDDNRNRAINSELKRKGVENEKIFNG